MHERSSHAVSHEWTQLSGLVALISHLEYTLSAFTATFRHTWGLESGVESPPSWDAGIILLNGADIAYSHAKTYIGAPFNFIFRSWVKITFSETGPKDDLPSLIWTPEGVLLQEMAQRA